ncbi:expressed unknown protein [Seminavis robusta]|uniref:BTB domain-containing protein n=1 Tax=Seminavis robusta TaxID=568900 RepID=A0A9N8EFM7_9STRA|nr:expressed unknown protein [Seminavis robusta]|eukprot:Sro1023_g232560.1 n/a (339) ;mRNA; r:29101-30117
MDPEGKSNEQEVASNDDKDNPLLGTAKDGKEKLDGQEKVDKDSMKAKVATRTPRKLESHDPDVIVVVGGVSFCHYKSILCTCGFFDTMLSSSMKESETGKIEFPDGDPEVWLEVYKFLDPLEYITLEQPISSLLTEENFDVLFPWFDYLGMEKHLLLCDNMKKKQIMKSHERPSFSMWEQYKSLPNFPMTKEAIINATKYSSHYVVRNATTKKSEFEELKKFLLDDECGDGVWAYFISTVVNLSEEMLNDLDRETIVTSPMFQYLVGDKPKPIPTMALSWASQKPAARKKMADSSSEEESSDEESSAPVKKRAPAPAPKPLPRVVASRRQIDSDSDSS